MHVNRGIYSLILHLAQSTVLQTGSLGELPYQAGYYVYTGSARGAGGFSRIQRHVRVSEGVNTTRHWHIDYLLPHTLPLAVTTLSTAEDLECQISEQIKTGTCGSIQNFGSTDCRCSSHLHRHIDFSTLLMHVLQVYHAHDGIVHLQLGLTQQPKTK